MSEEKKVAGSALSYNQAQVRVRRNLIIQSLLADTGEREVLNVPCVLGPTGAGKTAMAEMEAETFTLPLRAINNGENSDPTDVSGVPVPTMIRKLMIEGTDGEKREAQGAYMEWVLNRYAAEACETPVFLFFDDLDKAPPPVQGALLGILGNRSFRDRKIHKHTLIMCAGNRIEDDMYANQISESLRTRATIIEMQPDVVSFCEYGTATGKIHEIVMGFLQYKPEYLHKWLDGVSRFPTPRGWREVSVHMKEFPDPFEDVFGNGMKNNWQQIISEKCGGPVSKDFWGWFKIIRQINVKELLETGKINKVMLVDDEKKPVDKRMAQFAAIFAIASELNTRGVKKTYTGLDYIFDSNNKDGIEKEMRIALSVQLSRPVRADIGKMFPKAANELMSQIVPLDPPKQKKGA
jgi:hypothetical protein